MIKEKESEVSVTLSISLMMLRHSYIGYMERRNTFYNRTVFKTFITLKLITFNLYSV